jgi:hypothetical protein
MEPTQRPLLAYPTSVGAAEQALRQILKVVAERLKHPTRDVEPRFLDAYYLLLHDGHGTVELLLHLALDKKIVYEQGRLITTYSPANHGWSPEQEQAGAGLLLADCMERSASDLHRDIVLYGILPQEKLTLSIPELAQRRRHAYPANMPTYRSLLT